MFIKKRTAQDHGKLLILQTAEALHCCTGGRYYAAFEQLKDALIWGRQNGANSVIFAQNSDLYTLNIQVPEGTLPVDRDNALRYEVASLSHHEQDSIQLSLLPPNTIKSLRHPDIASVYNNVDIQQIMADLKRQKAHILGCTSIQQLLLSYHFNEQALASKALILFFEESAFLAIPQNNTLIYRNIPFGIHELESNPEQWETRIKRRFDQVEGLDIVMYTEKSNILLHQKIKELLQPNQLIMQSFDQILPLIFMEIPEKLSLANIPVKQNAFQNFTVQVFILILLSALGYSAYDYSVAFMKNQEVLKAKAHMDLVLPRIQAVEKSVSEANNQEHELTRHLEILKGNERIDTKLIKVINLLSRYKLTETRITELNNQTNTIEVFGESQNQTDMVSFFAHFEKVLGEYNLKLKSKTIEQKGEKSFAFTYVIEEVQP